MKTRGFPCDWAGFPPTWRSSPTHVQEYYILGYLRYPYQSAPVNINQSTPLLDELPNAEVRRLVELNPTALLVLTRGKIAFVNQAAQKLLGATDPSQLIGHLCDEFIPAAQKESFFQRVRRVVREGSVQAEAALPANIANLSSQNFQQTTFERLDGSRVDADVAVLPSTFLNKPSVHLIAHDLTDHEQANLELRAREAHKTAILESFPSAIISIDPSGKIHDWNTAAEKLFQHAKENALGRKLDDLIFPPSRRVHLTDHLMKGGDRLIGHPLILTAQCSTGVEIPVEFTITTVEAKSPPLYTIHIRDMSELKTTEEHLRRMEVSKDALVETALDAIASIDQSGRIVEWNSSAEGVFGYTRSLAVGKEFADLISPGASFDAQRMELRRNFISGRGRLISQRTEMTAVRASGGEFPLEISISRLPDQANYLFTCYMRDISERKKAEETLRKSEERFRLLVDGIDDYAIFMLDCSGRIVTWNAGAELIAGYGTAEVTGRRINRLYTPEDVMHGRPDQILATASAEGRYRFECWCVRKDGSRFRASVLVSALRNDRGEHYGYSCIMNDISKIIESEEMMKQANARLEAQLEEKTAQLQAAYQEMDAFANSISHDLRAPLQHISGFVDVLTRDLGPQLDERNRAYLEIINQSTELLGKMIHGILSYSRLSRATLHKEPTSLNAIVNEILVALRKTSGERKIIVNQTEIPDITCDPILIHQALYNVVANAFKFTGPRETAIIDISSRLEGGELIISIKDNGVGFDMKYAGKLFGVFQRLHSVNEFEGIGMGLAIVQRILRRHDGRIWASDATENGATFHLALPVSQDSPP